MRGCMRKLGISLGILAAIVVLVAGATWAYWYRGKWLYDRAWDTYYEGNPVEALALCRTIGEQYPSGWGLFDDFALRARYMTPELGDYLHAASLQDGGRVDEAVAAYESFLDEHHDGGKRGGSTDLYLSLTRKALAGLKLEQAQALQSSGEYARAIDVYRSLLKLETLGGEHCRAKRPGDKWGTACWEADVATEEGHAQARAAVPLVFLEWARVLDQQGNHEDYVQKYQVVLQEHPDMLDLAQAQASLSEVYGKWAAQLRQAGDLGRGIEQYEPMLQEYPHTLNRDQAEAILSQLYGEWAGQLREAGDYEEAIEKCQIILRGYPSTPTGAQVKAALAEIYAEWAAQLREAEDYEAAIEKYEIILRDYPDTPTGEQAQKAMAETHEEFAAWRERNPAIPVAEFPEELRRDSEDRWSWVTVFKETGGKVGYTLSGSGWIVDPKGHRYGPWGSIIDRGSVTVPAGGKAEDSYWFGGDRFIDGHAVFTWSGEDASGHAITIEEKVHLLP